MGSAHGWQVESEKEGAAHGEAEGPGKGQLQKASEDSGTRAGSPAGSTVLRSALHAEWREGRHTFSLWESRKGRNGSTWHPLQPSL